MQCNSHHIHAIRASNLLVLQGSAASMLCWSLCKQSVSECRLWSMLLSIEVLRSASYLHRFAWLRHHAASFRHLSIRTSFDCIMPSIYTGPHFASISCALQRHSDLCLPSSSICTVGTDLAQLTLWTCRTRAKRQWNHSLHKSPLVIWPSFTLLYMQLLKRLSLPIPLNFYYIINCVVVEWGTFHLDHNWDDIMHILWLSIWICHSTLVNFWCQMP